MEMKRRKDRTPSCCLALVTQPIAELGSHSPRGAFRESPNRSSLPDKVNALGISSSAPLPSQQSTVTAEAG